MVPICPAPHLVTMMGAYGHLAQSFLGIGEAKMSNDPQNPVEPFGLLPTFRGWEVRGCRGQ